MRAVGCPFVVHAVLANNNGEGSSLWFQTKTLVLAYDHGSKIGRKTRTRVEINFDIGVVPPLLDE